MKKVLLFTTVFFMLVSMTSCKKLLGLDPESLLTKEPWQGNKIERYENGVFKVFDDVPTWNLEFDKETHYFKGDFYYESNLEGRWAYDEENNLIILNFNGGNRIEWKIKVLKKNELVVSWFRPSQVEIRLYFKRE